MTSTENKLAQTEDLRMRLTHLLTCAICKDRYKNPKVLRCSHIFCSGCLENVYHKSEHRNCAPCPMCRESFFPPDHTVANLPNSSIVQGLLDVLEDEDESLHLKGPTCEFCQSEFAVVENVCMDCSIKMCAKCTTIHDKMQRETHTVFPLSNIKGTPLLDVLNEKEKSRLCATHPEQQYIVYCQTCDLPLCAQCVGLHSGSHNRITFKEAAQEIKEYLAGGLLQNEPHIEFLEDAYEKLQSHKRLLDASTSDAKLQIEDTANQYRNWIEKKEQLCMENVNEMYQAKTKELENMLEAVEMQLVIRRNLQEQMRSVQSFGTELVLAKSKKSIKNQLEQLTHQDTKTFNIPEMESFGISFSPDVHMLKTMIKFKLGDVTDWSAKPTLNVRNIRAAVQNSTIRLSITSSDDPRIQTY